MLAAHQPRIAARRYLEALETITGCVTPRRLVVRPEGHAPNTLYSVAFGRSADPVMLPAKAGGSSGLLLDMRQHYDLVSEETIGYEPSWHVMARAYEYRILDSLERELLVFHWQPLPITRGPDLPHLHVSATLVAQTSATVSQRHALDKRHVPTGQVSLAAVVRLLIAEFGIAYRHRNWATRLQRAEDVFQREQGHQP